MLCSFDRNKNNIIIVEEGRSFVYADNPTRQGGGDEGGGGRGAGEWVGVKMFACVISEELKVIRHAFHRKSPSLRFN